MLISFDRADGVEPGYNRRNGITDKFTLYNAFASCDFKWRRMSHTVPFNINNITDVDKFVRTTTATEPRTMKISLRTEF